MALDILTVPSMSAECERLFSIAKHMITSVRSNLDADIIEMRQVLRSWYRAGVVTTIDPILLDWIEEKERREQALKDEVERIRMTTAWLVQREDREGIDVVVEEEDPFA